MPLVKGDGTGVDEQLASRIRNTKKLLAAAAAIMSVMLIGSSVVTSLLDSARRVRGGRTGQRTSTGVSGASRSRRHLRYGLRSLHDQHSLVCRRLRHGRPADARASLSAALWDGARVGAREPAARAHHHRRVVLHHLAIRRERRRAGGSVCDRRARPDYVSGAGGDHLDAGEASVVRDRPGDLRLCDGRQYHRAAGRSEDRRMVRRRHRHHVARLARRALDGAQVAGRRVRRHRRTVSSRPLEGRRCVSSPIGPTRAFPTSMRTS